MISKYKIAVFDFDGTVMNSAPGVISCIKYAQEKMSNKLLETEEYYKFLGPPLQYSFTNFLKMSHEEAEKAIIYYREKYKESGSFNGSPYNGIVELVEELHSCGVITAIGSAKPEKILNRIAEHFELDKCFDCITGSQGDGAVGDKDVIISLVYDRIKSQHKEFENIPLAEAGIVMIGDRTYDAIGARKLGIDFIGALYGYGTEEEFTNEGYTNIAKDVQSIKEFFI